jgi:hypothetical protein
MPVISVCCLIALARASSSPVLNTSGESGRPCLSLSLEEQLLPFSPFIGYLFVRVCHICLLLGCVLSLLPILLSDFLINRCCIQAGSFGAAINMTIWFLSFILLISVVYQIELFAYVGTILLPVGWTTFDQCYIDCHLINVSLLVICWYFASLLIREIGL